MILSPCPRVVTRMVGDELQQLEKMCPTCPKLSCTGNIMSNITTSLNMLSSVLNVWEASDRSGSSDLKRVYCNAVDPHINMHAPVRSFHISLMCCFFLCVWFLQLCQPLFNRCSLVPSDIEKVVVIKEEIPVDHIHPDSLHIKEEHEELGISPEEHISGGGEVDKAVCPFTVVTVKIEDEAQDSPLIERLANEEQREVDPSASSRTAHRKVEPGGEDSEGDQESDCPSQLNTDTQSSDSFEMDVSSEENSNDSFSLEDRSVTSSDPSALKYREVTLRGDGSETQSLLKVTEKNNVNAAGDKPFVCNICGKRFCQMPSLSRHKKIHSGEKKFSCDICGKRFNIKSKLKEHVIVHSGEKPFSCDLCGKTFNNKPYLKRHMIVHTGDKPYSCEVCGKRFNHKPNIKLHMRVHTGEKPFECDFCGKSFSHMRSLSQHMTIHTGEKPFSCDVCGKSFHQMASLSRHRRIHTGEKLFPCDICGKRFNLQSKLDAHVRVHTGEKPFSCEVCGKCFVDKSYLKKHMIVHVGDKPFSCDICGKRFNQKTPLKTHQRVHTQEKPFACDVCGKRYKISESLKKHVQMHLGERPLEPAESAEKESTLGESSTSTSECT